MAKKGTFQSDNNKYTKKINRVDTSNPDFNPAISVNSNKDKTNFQKNLHKWRDLVAYYRWYPDLWYQLITPETGGIKLTLDQRLFLRVLVRFFSAYGCFPRGYGKTFIEVMAMIHICVFFPNMKMAMSAQTKENAASLLEDKFKEILQFYPLLRDEIYSTKFNKMEAEVGFKNGSVIDILANAQSSKGQRRRRLIIEESALLNNELFQDVLEPIPNVPRLTVGRKGIVDPKENNGSISYVTTTGYRGSDEYHRNLKMIEQMRNLEGRFVLGSSWELGCFYGRGEPKARILEKQQTLSPIMFARNYREKWVGSDENAIVNANKLLDCRVLTKTEKVADKNGEYYLGVDVARSGDGSNNQTSVSILKVIRTKSGRIKNVQVVNIITIIGTLNFTNQAIRIKNIKKRYNARVVIVDTNGLGVGLVDELLKTQMDLTTGEVLQCWNTINTDATPEDSDFDRCIYDLKPQSANSDIITVFMDMVESSKLQFLQKRETSDYDINDNENYEYNILPFVQTDFVIDEILNIRVKHLPNGKLAIEKVVKKLDKDRFTSLAYGLWYIKVFLDNAVVDDGKSDFDYLSEFARIF